jgi:hypothetical protein
MARSKILKFDTDAFFENVHAERDLRIWQLAAQHTGVAQRFRRL